MLIIRKRQMQALQAGVVDAYVAASVQRIERRYPEHFGRMGKSGTEQLVRDGVAKAARFGIEDDPQVDRFIDLMVLIAPAFEALPDWDETLDILEDNGIDEEAKLDLIYEAHAEDKMLAPAFTKDLG